VRGLRNHTSMSLIHDLLCMPLIRLHTCLPAQNTCKFTCKAIATLTIRGPEVQVFRPTRAVCPASTIQTAVRIRQLEWLSIAQLRPWTPFCATVQCRWEAKHANHLRKRMADNDDMIWYAVSPPD
jgi:hypothetical protein